MTGPIHPSVMRMLAAQHRAEIRAEVDRHRLTRLARPNTSPLQHWAGLAAAVAIVVAFALWLAGGLAVPEEWARSARPDLSIGDRQTITQLVDGRFLDLGATRQISAARL